MREPETSRVIVDRSPAARWGKLLVSISNLMGVPVDTYGYAGLGTGGLPDLLS
ncbi:MAG TPA: hypothetical protein VM734_07355 [Kofleriaceae bacterium]|nr:hypothetical protein [Kofleriaceae bacterium]